MPGKTSRVAPIALAVLALISAGSALAEPKAAVPTVDFLNSIGVNSTFPDRQQPLDKTIEMARYGGFRWLRAGIEGLTESGPTTLKTYLELHRATDIRFSWGLVSGGTDIDKLIRTAKVIEQAGALIAIEGNNEPNNWGVVYKGRAGGGSAPSWLAVAELQRDLYKAVKSDPVLAKYPVWSISEPGGQRDNTGLQFLTIPPGADTLMPDGTQYADVANVHNYVYHPRSPRPADNTTWHAADPSAQNKVDGLFGNFGLTWAQKFQGYSQDALNTLPRVTTETGAQINKVVSPDQHGLNLLSLYLAQFKRGYSHTAVYLLRDRTDEGGNQAYGFFRPNYTPRKAAVYLHNLTTILADRERIAKVGGLDYTIARKPPTVHDLLLQHSDGGFRLIVWGERLKGEDAITVQLGAPHASIEIYDPTTGTAPIQKLAGVDTIELTMSNHPYIIAIGAPKR